MLHPVAAWDKWDISSIIVISPRPINGCGKYKYRTGKCFKMKREQLIIKKTSSSSSIPWKKGLLVTVTEVQKKGYLLRAIFCKWSWISSLNIFVNRCINPLFLKIIYLQKRFQISWEISNCETAVINRYVLWILEKLPRGFSNTLERRRSW